jgi:tetratricopeptide (TPR) repeat protein
LRVNRRQHVWAAGCTLAVCIVSLSFSQNSHPSSDPALMRELHQAISLADQGEQQRAMTITLELLARDPKFISAIKLKGTLLEEAGRRSEAAAVFEQGLKLAPNDPDLLLKTGIYKLAAGNRNEAIKLLRECARILPDDGDTQFYLAQAYHLNGQDELALPAIKRSLKSEPDNPSVWQKYGELLCSTGDCEAGLRWLLKAQHADASLPRLDFDIAATDYKMMDLVGAAPYAERAAASEPNDVNTWQLMATVNVKLAHWEQAQTGFERVLAMKSDDVEALLGLGQCEVELKNFAKGMATLESVLRLDPTRLLAHFYLSRAYAGLGRTAEAQHEAALHQLMMEQLTFARSMSSDERESSIKGQAQMLLTLHREADALELYLQHFKGTSASPADAYVFIGKLYLFMHETDAGLRCLHHALNIQPTARGAHTYEGILALKLGDLNRAEKEFQAELANDPNYQMAIAELGEVRYHQQRWAEAAELLAKSKTTTPELLYMLCDSDFHLGKVEDADLNAEAMAAYARGNPQLMNGLLGLLDQNGQSELARKLQGNLAN